MGYSLTPIIVDLPKVKSLMRSKNVAVLQELIRKYRKSMLNTDAMGSYFDEFEDEIKAEYKRFVNGDFSTVDLNATYPERKEEEPELDEETAALRAEYERLNETDPDAAKQLLFNYLQEGLDSDDEDDDDDEEEEEEEIVKETTTGAALAHMILGGNTDPSIGYKYGYVLLALCEHLGGDIPEHDAWCSMRSSADVAGRVDRVLKKAGVSPEVFSVSEFLINRGAPVPIPKPDNFPFIGYLTREEIRQILPLLSPAKLDAAIRGAPDRDRDWIGVNIDELRQWLEQCASTDRDLVCFYD